MEVKTTVFKRKSGKAKGKWTARFQYYDSTAGKNKIIEREVPKRADAIDERDRPRVHRKDECGPRRSDTGRVGK